MTTVAGTNDVQNRQRGRDRPGRHNFLILAASWLTASGPVFVADTDNQTIRRITPAGAVTTLAGQSGEEGRTDGTGNAAQFACPICITMDAAGSLYVADLGIAAIRKGVPANPVGGPLLTSAKR